MIPAAIPGESNRSALGGRLFPLVLGVLIGAVASLDPLLSWGTVQPVGFGEVARLVPYLYSLGIVVGASALAFAVARRGPLYRGDRGVLFSGILIVGMYMSGIGYGQASVTAAATVVLLAAWGLERVLNPHTPWNPTVFAGIMILFTACEFLSTIGAPTTLVGIATLMVKAIVAVLLADTLRSTKQVRSTCTVLVWATAVSAFLALLQVAASTFYGLNYTLVEDRNSALVNAPWGGQMIVQASALTRENNSLACMLATVSLLTLAQLFSSSGTRRRAVLGAAVLLMWSMAFLTTVRGSYVAITVGALVFPYIFWPRRWPQVTGAILLVGTLALSSGAVTATLRMMDSIRQSSVDGRVELLQPGIDAVLTYPWNGRGQGQSFRYSPHNRWGPHNTPVQIASDLGVPAAVLLVSLVVWIGVRLAWAAGWAATPLARTQCLALLAGFVPLVTVMQSEPMAYGQFLWVYLGLCEAGAAAAVAGR